MLSTLVFSVTYTCPIQCDFCGVHSGPHRKGMLTLDTIKDLIDQAKAMGTFSVIVFTGGEPTLLGKRLNEAIAYATQHGFSTRIVSNAVWATSPEKAHSFLARLKEAGLTELNYSIDDFHQEHIPLERVKWAAEAAAELNIPLLIAAKGIKNSKINPVYIEAFFDKGISRHREGQRIQPGRVYYTWGVTVPVGWNAAEVPDEELLWPEEKDCWKGPCKSVLKSVVVRYNGDLSICCGIGSDEVPETVIGNIYDEALVDIIARGNDDLIVNWLALEGPNGIIEFLREQDPSLKFRDCYIGVCHACHDVLSRAETRRVLQENIAKAVPRIGVERAWLETHRAEIAGIEPRSEEESHA